MVLRLSIVLALAVAAGGCSTVEVSGTGDFYTLSDRNVIERDLTRPVGINNEPEYPKYHTFPAPL